MPSSIIISRVPVAADQRDELAKLLSSPTFSLLKEIIGARCAEHQVKLMEADLYAGENEEAKAEAESHRSKARTMNAVLDTLDDIAKNEDEWFTMTLEPRR